MARGEKLIYAFYDSRRACGRRDVCADEMATQFIAARDRNASYRVCDSSVSASTSLIEARPAQERKQAINIYE
jgi:hypothetical protein